MDLANQAGSLPAPIWLFGLPVTPLSFEQAIEAILEWADTSEPGCRFVVTSNVDFLVKTLTWFPSGPRHPELADVLRSAAMNTADGMPLVWAARWLGAHLPARVSGSDLVPELARRAARAHLPVFLLGGQQPVTEHAASTLQRENPELKIAGVDCPFVFTEGGRIAFEAERDRALCRRIEESGARILLIGFGNPKQEMWFQRNSYRLTPGVALGVGGTFNFVAGEIRRAPAWMQRAGLEWLFRLLEEPGRLWKRYAIGLAKFAVIAAPPVLAHWVANRTVRGSAPPRLLAPFLAGKELVRVILLPERLDAAGSAALRALVTEADTDALVLDASNCRFADAAGFGTLWQIIQQGRRHGRYLFAPTRSLRALAALHRATDFLYPFTCPHLADLVLRIEERFPVAGCFVSIEGSPETTRVAFLGGLTADDLRRVDREMLVDALGRTNLVFDLSYCRRIDGDGLALLLRLKEYAAAHGFTASVHHAPPEVIRSIEVADLARELLDR